MSYSFWDTVQGNRLSEVLIRTLPEIAEKDTALIADAVIKEIRTLREETEALHRAMLTESSWKQYTIKCKRWNDISTIINREIFNGSVYVDSIEYTDYIENTENNQILIIMKRPI